MRDYYVTQSGSATPLSTSVGSPSSVATFNASTLPTGGDIVHFIGTITSTIAPNTSGTGNGAGRLLLDFASATLNGPGDNSAPRILNNAKNYITYSGGGFWAQGGSGIDSVFTPGVIIGSQQSHHPTSQTDYGDNVFKFNTQTSHDITIDGFQSVLTISDGNCGFIEGRYANNLLVSNCNILNNSNLYFSDGFGTHDITFSGIAFDQSENLMEQSDIIALGDAYNITIEKNKFTLRSPGENAINSRHNDMIQLYLSGGGGAGPGYGWVIRYNCFILDVHGPLHTAGAFIIGRTYRIASAGTTNWAALGASSSAVGTVFVTSGVGSGTGTANYIGTGDTSFSQFENLVDTGGIPALKVYANVFIGTDTDYGSNNGFGGGDSNVHTVYYHHNTMARSNNGPGNSLIFNTNVAGSSLYARNNICWAPTSLYDGSAFNMAAGATWNRNYFFNWQTPTSTMAGPNGSLILDPLFVSRTLNDYSLQSGSPCKGVADNSIGTEFAFGIAPGSTWPNPALNTRPVGGAWDAGAFQSAAVGGVLANPRIQRRVTASAAGGGF